MNTTDLRELYDYDRWASDRILDAVEKLDASQAAMFTEARSHGIGAVRDLLAHVADAQRYWLARLDGNPIAMPDTTRFSDVASLRQHCRDSNAAVVAYLDGAGDTALAGNFEFSFRPGGDPIRIRIDRLLHHIAVHAINHRAEASELLTAAGSPPGSLDLMGYYRATGQA